MRLRTILFGGLLLLLGASLLVNTTYADVNDFTFKNFTGNYYLTRDEQGRSNLRVVETFTAEFPHHDQNKGVVRVIPNEYDGHSTSFKLESLKRNGQPEPVYSQEQKDTDIVLSTGTDQFLQGDQTYELAYTLRDVTKDFGSHQEFYWDTVGTRSPQPFGQVVAHVHLDESTRELFQGDIACYQGRYGSDTPCSAVKSGDTVTFRSGGHLPAGHNVSMVLRFEEGAFLPYKESFTSVFMNAILPVSATGFAVLGVIGAIITRRTKGRDARGRGTVVPEYIPPAEVSVMQSSGLVRGARSVLPAQLLDLAVRRKIQLIESEGKKRAKHKTYTLKLVSSEGLKSDEQEVVVALFGAGAKPGDTYTLDSVDRSAGIKLTQITHASATAQLVSEGYRKKVKVVKTPIIIAALGFIGALITVLWQSRGSQELGAASLIAMPAFFGVGIAWMLLATMRPLTKKGIEMKEYLNGLKHYISLAEADRLKALQSPQGVQKTPIDTKDGASLLHLYERVLPYAMLFGLERQWGKVLEVSYAQAGAQPGWYESTSDGFNVGLLSSVLSDFSTAASTQLVSPSSDGSSGGSGFSGGFSGGGGGGGGFGGR